MDPDACLKEIREILESRPKDTDENAIAAYMFDVSSMDRLVELVHALDEWLCNGGFTPKAWQKSDHSHWQSVLTSTNARAYAAGYNDGLEEVRNRIEQVIEDLGGKQDDHDR